MINIKKYKQQGAEKHFLFISVYWMHIKHVNHIFGGGEWDAVKSSFLGLFYHMIWYLRIYVFYL